MGLHLDIITPDKKIFSGEVVKIVLPSQEGQITVLPKHMPLVTALEVGEVIVQAPKETMNFSIGKGIFSINDNNASLLIEDVLASEEISEEKAIEAKKLAEELIKKGIGPEEKKAAIHSLRKSLVDLKLVRKKKRKILT